jgi:hypothetical protein
LHRLFIAYRLLCTAVDRAHSQSEGLSRVRDELERFLSADTQASSTFATFSFMMSYPTMYFDRRARSHPLAVWTHILMVIYKHLRFLGGYPPRCCITLYSTRSRHHFERVLDTVARPSMCEQTVLAATHKHTAAPRSPLWSYPHTACGPCRLCVPRNIKVSRRHTRHAASHARAAKPRAPVCRPVTPTFARVGASIASNTQGGLGGDGAAESSQRAARELAQARSAELEQVRRSSDAVCKFTKATLHLPMLLRCCCRRCHRVICCQPVCYFVSPLASAAVAGVAALACCCVSE